MREAYVPSIVDHNLAPIRSKLALPATMGRELFFVSFLSRHLESTRCGSTAFKKIARNKTISVADDFGLLAASIIGSQSR